MTKNINIPVFDITGKTAIITGGTKGLGYGMAATFANYGANVIITARTASDCERVAGEIDSKYCRGGRCIGVPADSVSAADIGRVIETSVREFGGLDILINNAGMSGKTANLISEDCDEANFDKVLSTNLKGVFLFSKAAARQMVNQGRGGKIINISSIEGYVGGEGAVAFGASKAGVINLTKSMARELSRYGITVNAICPGKIVTPMNEGILANEDIKDKIESGIPLKRMGAVEEVAGPVLAMVSEPFGFVTGVCLLIDGGEHM